MVAYVLQLKDLGGRGVGEKATLPDGNIGEGLEGLPGGRTWEAGTKIGARATKQLLHIGTVSQGLL